MEIKNKATLELYKAKLSANLEAKLKSKELEVATVKLTKIETANVTYLNLYWKYFEIIHKHYFVKSKMSNPYTKKNG